MNTSLLSRANWPYALAYLAVWGATLSLLTAKTSFQPDEAIAGFVILALIFPALTLLLTWLCTPIDYRVARPQLESVLLLLYLLFIALVLVIGFGRLSRITAEPLHSIVILVLKLVVFVALPAMLLLFTGNYSIRTLFPFSLRFQHLWPAFAVSLASLVMQSLIGHGLQDVREAHLPASVLLIGLPLSFAYLLVEVGLVEEFFFRALLQERLSAALRSPWGGLLISAFLFGLVHAPGFYLRPDATQEALGPHPSLFLAVGYSVVFTSLAGLFLGILWMRTRNLATLLIAHAAADLLPNLVPFLKTFHLMK
jgi:uncharacterized protein